MGMDLSTCRQNVFIELPDLQQGVKAVCSHADKEWHALVGYDVGGDEHVVVLECEDGECQARTLKYQNPSAYYPIAQAISFHGDNHLVVATTQEIKIIDISEEGSADTRVITLDSSGEFLASLVVYIEK